MPPKIEKSQNRPEYDLKCPKSIQTHPEWVCGLVRDIWDHNLQFTDEKRIFSKNRSTDGPQSDPPLGGGS